MCIGFIPDAPEPGLPELIRAAASHRAERSWKEMDDG
jgi:hypothetical protein